MLHLYPRERSILIHKYAKILVMSVSRHPIHPYYSWFAYIPFISKTGFNTLFTSTIYLNKDLYIDSQKKTITPFTMALIKHQEVHADGASILKAVRFIFSPKFRLREEAAAYKAQFRHQKKYNIPCDLKKIANQFATVRYLWVMNIDDAQNFIQKIWNSA